MGFYNEYKVEDLKFIIALTEHRFLGTVFQAFFIQKKEQFYSVVRLVKPRDFKAGDYRFQPYEKKLVETIERYSDERLMKRFSRAASVSDFYTSMRSGFYEKQLIPFVEKCMMEATTILMLSPVQLYKKEAKYSNIYDEDEIGVPPFFATPEYHFERSDSFTRYRLKIILDEKEIQINTHSTKVISNNPCLILHKNQLLAFEKFNSKRLLPFFEKDFIEVPNTIEDKYYHGFIQKTIRDYPVKAKGFTIEEANVQKTALLSIEKDLHYQPGLVLKFRYGHDTFPTSSKSNTVVSCHKKDNSFVFLKMVRDFAWEQKVLETVSELGLVEKEGFFRISGMHLLEQQNALYFLINWLNKNKPMLETRGIGVEQDKLEKSYFTGNQQLELQTQTKGDWFDVYAVVRFGEFSIPFIKLKKYILNDIREFVLPNGEIAVLPEEWFARYKGILPFGKQRGDTIQFEKHHFSILQHALKESDKSVFRKYEEILGGEKPDIPPPANLQAKLRSYQLDGYRWMFNLYKNGLGGCLADDMGLGKTIQTLTLLLKLKRARQAIKIQNPLAASNQLDLFSDNKPEDESPQSASLIVVPTSLVHNWENEIKKFTPTLRAYKHVGALRKKAVDLGKIASFYDVILTTYGTVRNDIAVLEKTEFFYLILDESQSIKNASSKTYKAVLDLQAKHKLVITGTPIENSLSDLWSQMNFLNPGILGSLAFFRRSFITPIEKHANEEQQEKLQLIIRPFVLRRKKDEVARDLPPLMEETRLCPMSAGQKKMYDREKSIIRNTILSAIEKEGLNKAQFVVLQGLTRLRQLSNHPGLLEENSEIVSGKFEEILRMLENLVAEKHKVLIFSSFVSHLELLQKKIEQQGWKFSKLIGQTTKREVVIKDFQDDPEKRIFLISLKAGGVGLNLTEADYVFIIDPWWNPAAENQAINRAHRIGQDKHVFVYRFITENSIEEKIQKLKDRKRSLADKFINSNNPFEQISKEEMVELLK